MKRIFLSITLLVCSCCLLQAQDEAAMKNWQNYMTPGDMHKMMASWNGKWKGEVTLWMAPDAPPITNTMTAENKMIMNGLYQVSHNKGSFNGMPFEGMSTLAYDNHKKQFETTWIDNMGSGIMHLYGPWDPATKSITLTGKMVDPITGNPVEVKEIYKVLSNDSHMMEMYAVGPDGKEMKTMEIKFSREK